MCIRDRVQIERLSVPEHQKALALTAWDLGSRSSLEALRLHSHAHAFGYTGQLITKSLGYSTTFKALREKRAAYTKPNNEFEVYGGFGYDGRGYEDPRSADLAKMLFEARNELRQERSKRLREASNSLPSGTGEFAVSPGEVAGESHQATPILNDSKGGDI